MDGTGTKRWLAAAVLSVVTDERPEVGRQRSQPERYGAGWAPVLVAWDHVWVDWSRSLAQ